MYVQRRRRVWYALQEIPADLRAKLGKARFVRSLETEDRFIAKRRALALELQWRSEMEQARNGTTDHAEADAQFWRRALRDAKSDVEKAALRDAIADEAKERVVKAAEAAGIQDLDDAALDDLPAVAEAERFFAIATGQLVKMDEHLEEYLATLKKEAKTIDMQRKTVRRFSEAFPYVSDVKRKDVQRWINGILQQGRATATIRRNLSELRGYWSYLASIEVIPEDNLPFDKLTTPNAGKRTSEDERKPFKPADVVALMHAAEAKGDSQLADLIRLGMWTGARIEELCAMPLGNVGEGFIEIEDAKTDSGWRQVPIHSKLAPTIARLKETSKDGFLLSGLSLNKYGDRSNAIGKRFGLLKTKRGFGLAYVYHSIRKTVATLLEDAGVTENVAADIIGHDKPTMTYGLYSGGTSLETKRQALEKIGYPGV